jgi:dihydropteroate synthase
LVFGCKFELFLSKNNQQPMKKILSCGGKMLDLGKPVVMGVLNLTPDSFYDGGFYSAEHEQLSRVETMLNQGASIIDIGAVSTRPGSEAVDEDEELQRLIPSLIKIIRHFPETIFSIDTYRSAVAREAIEHGAGMINDIYGGRYDPEIFRVVQSANLPYILMHMQGEPTTMQLLPVYEDIVEEITGFFREQIGKFANHYDQIILDPGFGFGKTVEHGFRLLADLGEFKKLGYPLMVGLSRKSMINRVLHTRPSEALNGTTVLNTIALLKGADILRVHDVKEAVQAIQLVSMLTD